jgi:hypothetical protein
LNHEAGQNCALLVVLGRVDSRGILSEPRRPSSWISANRLGRTEIYGASDPWALVPISFGKKTGTRSPEAASDAEATVTFVEKTVDDPPEREH